MKKIFCRMAASDPRPKLSGITMRTYLFIAICLFAMLLAPYLTLAQQPAQMASNKQCTPYQDAINNKKLDVIPRELFTNWSLALQCLVPFLANASASIKVSNDVIKNPDLLRVIKAVRVVIDQNGVAAIEQFRRSDNDLRAISTLTFAARSSSSDYRVNATLILGNVIDNSSVCVPLDHLYDPKIDSRGRVNLLAVSSVVIPWSSIENLNNISKMLFDIRSTLPTDLQDTAHLINIMEARVSERRQNSVPSGEDLLAQCHSQKLIWAAGKLKY